MEERLQKLLSAAGVCSRRSAERYITEGRVKVNGVPAQLGMKADPERDEITVDGTALPQTEKRVWLMLNKPAGRVTTLSDEKGRKTAAELVADCGVRVWPVGRLDIDSEGLLLFTNDGEGTHHLLHPGHEVEKEYHVIVEGDASAALPILNGPMELDGELLAPAKVSLLDQRSASARLSVIIHQGKNRQVRRMCAAAGLTVKRLRRVREGTLHLGELPAGKWRWLTGEEVSQLLS
ncbi:pseudouridine synthase [Vermiculatibacterium agrestimuris]|uniref:pseudouridine synthase n=1 Tax=Vermiculatibacterium agrestimuris TaxID=2941519 RepID=UPI0020425D3A|nr:pseudouridine synthase [Vermiculatibacterium agrestimuris]